VNGGSLARRGRLKLAREIAKSTHSGHTTSVITNGSKVITLLTFMGIVY
jgi:hypothetical protein